MLKPISTDILFRDVPALDCGIFGTNLPYTEFVYTSIFEVEPHSPLRVAVVYRIRKTESNTERILYYYPFIDTVYDKIRHFPALIHQYTYDNALEHMRLRNRVLALRNSSYFNSALGVKYAILITAEKAIAETKTEYYRAVLEEMR